MINESLFIQSLRKMVKENKTNIELFEIVKYDAVNKKIVIKRPHEKTEFDNVINAGVAFGNNRGIAFGYSVGDSVLVVDMMGQFVIVGTLFNEFFKWNKRQLQSDTEIWPEEKEIIIQSDSLARIKLKADGSFKAFNKDGYGLECDVNGVLTLRGTEINQTQTRGTW